MGKKNEQDHNGGADEDKDTAEWNASSWSSLEGSAEENSSSQTFKIKMESCENPIESRMTGIV